MVDEGSRLAWREMMLWKMGNGKRPAPPDLIMTLPSFVKDQLKPTWRHVKLTYEGVERLRQQGISLLRPLDFEVVKELKPFHRELVRLKGKAKGTAVLLDSVARAQVIEDLNEAAREAIRAINRALSTKNYRFAVPADLVGAFRGVARMARLVGLAGLAAVLLELLNLAEFLERVGLKPTPTTILDRAPPPLRPLDLTPKAEPNAPGIAA